MRDNAPGRHARRRPPSLRPYLLALLAAVSALVTALTFATGPSKAVTLAPAAHQARAAAAAPGQDRVNKADLARAVTAARTAAARHAASVLAAHTYLVRAGDSISGVAVRKCAAARDWTGIYAASRAYGWTARNANQITAGQKLYLLCAYDAAQLKFAAAPAAPAAHATVAAAVTATGTRHDRFDGQHGACGDGDHDGMDASCSVIFPQRYQSSGSSRSYHRTYHAAVSGSSYASSGTYSYSGLEALWISAGGPAWAAAHAASIAECESGGRTSAYNPSGATGLWQILGSVVSGNLYNAYTNALNAVAKFKASGDTFSQWVCT